MCRCGARDIDDPFPQYCRLCRTFTHTVYVRYDTVDFCRYCGANKPPIAGEGTCQICCPS